MPRVRYTGDGGRYRAGGHTFEPGDTRDVPEGLAEHLVHTVGAFEYTDDHVTDVEYTEVDQTQPDEEAEESTDDESEDETEEGQSEEETDGETSPDDSQGDAVEREGSKTLPFNPESHTIDELEDRVQDVDDPETLRALLNIEQNQKDRSGATDAIQSRIDELSDDGEEA